MPRDPVAIRPTVAERAQRHSLGRYFEASVVVAVLHNQTTCALGGVPAASGAPPERGTIASTLPASTFAPNDTLMVVGAQGGVKPTLRSGMPCAAFSATMSFAPDTNESPSVTRALTV